MNILLFLQSDSITQPEEMTSPTVLIVAAMVLVSIITGVFLWLLALRILFFKNAVKTDGKVTGLLGAIHKGIVSADIPYVGKLETKDTTASGYILTIEYETDEFVYSTKSKKSYRGYQVGDTIPVHYRRDDPKDCAANGVYELNPKLAYGVITGGIISLLILSYLLLVS